MRLLLTFFFRDGYRVAFLRDDARTSFGRKFMVADREALIRVVAKLNGDLDDLQRSLRQWNQGSVWINPSQAQLNWLVR